MNKSFFAALRFLYEKKFEEIDERTRPKAKAGNNLAIFNSSRRRFYKKKIQSEEIKTNKTWQTFFAFFAESQHRKYIVHEFLV